MNYYAMLANESIVHLGDFDDFNDADDAADQLPLGAVWIFSEDSLVMLRAQIDAALDRLTR